MKQRRLVAMIAGGAIAAATLSVAPSAQAADTTATFTLANAGFLSISVPTGTVDLGTATSTFLSGVQASGKLGDTTVTDNRNSLRGWQVTADSTDFVNGTDNVGEANVTIDAGTPTAQTVTGLFVPTPGGTKGTGNGGVIGTTPSSLVTLLTNPLNTNNAVTYSPTITITVPAGLPDGTYTGTITQTVTGL